MLSIERNVTGCNNLLGSPPHIILELMCLTGCMSDSQPL